MKKKVNLKIRSEQYHTESSPVVIESRAEGEMKSIPGGWEILYKETAESGYADTFTTIYVYGSDNVRMERQGSNTMDMEFKKGKTHTSIMNTPYGSITITFLTGKVSADINESGGEIKLSYSINSYGEIPVKTNLSISVN